MPDAIGGIVAKVCAAFPNTRVGIHCHNDSGCAVSASILAVRAGAAQVQGTFIGIGERCGNANLSTIVPNLRLKMGMDCKGDLPGLRHAAMKDAIAHGNRLIMLYEGRIVIDVEGEEKRKLTVEKLLTRFSQASGSDEADDKMLLS